MGKSGCFLRGKPAATESRYPTYVHAEYLCFRNPPNSDMDYSIFNVRTNVSAGCTDTVRESALKVDPVREKKKKLAVPGIEPASATCRSDALPTELQYRLSFLLLLLLLSREIKKNSIRVVTFLRLSFLVRCRLYLGFTSAFSLKETKSSVSQSVSFVQPEKLGIKEGA